jgi:hypothetical protein
MTSYNSRYTAPLHLRPLALPSSLWRRESALENCVAPLHLGQEVGGIGFRDKSRRSAHDFALGV